MNCILHIGTEKTGTTSLQEFLHLNREALRRSGYLYTKSAGLRNNQSLALAAYSSTRRDDLTRRRGLRTGADLASFQHRTIKRLSAELKRGKSVHTTIFSSEHIQSRLRTSEELLHLRHILSRLGFHRILVIVYLRNPAGTAVSLYSTAVKSGSTDPAPQGPETQYYRNLCDHRATISRFSTVFGRNAVIPRLFAKTDLVNGSIIADFAQTIGIPFPSERFVIPPSKNESMSALGLEILRRINRQLPIWLDHERLNPLRENLTDYLSENFQKGARYNMPVELYQAYQEAFRDSNAWVRAVYFPTRSLLFGACEAPIAQQNRFHPNELDQIAKTISAVWLTKSRQPLREFLRRTFAKTTKASC